MPSLSVMTWLRIGAVLAALGGVYGAYSWAYSRGADDARATAKIKIDALNGDIDRLQTGIAEANHKADVAAAQGRAEAAESAERAQASLAEIERQRRTEAARGPGAQAMNEFWAETFR